MNAAGASLYEISVMGIREPETEMEGIQEFFFRFSMVPALKTERRYLMR